jgi:hypothetical protein
VIRPHCARPVDPAARGSGWVAAVALVSFVLAGCGTDLGTSPTNEASPPPVTAPSSPTPSPTQPDASSAPASPADGTDTEWARVTVPVEGIGWDTATAVVRGGDRYLALGRHFEPNPHIGYDGAGRLWASTDGMAWESVGLPADIEYGNLVSLVATPAGEFLLFANSYDAESVLRPIVLRSTDGLAWDVEPVDLPSRLYLTRVVSRSKRISAGRTAMTGPVGYGCHRTDWPGTRSTS